MERFPAWSGHCDAEGDLGFVIPLSSILSGTQTGFDSWLSPSYFPGLWCLTYTDLWPTIMTFEEMVRSKHLPLSRCLLLTITSKGGGFYLEAFTWWSTYIPSKSGLCTIWGGLHFFVFFGWCFEITLHWYVLYYFYSRLYIIIGTCGDLAPKRFEI